MATDCSIPLPDPGPRRAVFPCVHQPRSQAHCKDRSHIRDTCPRWGHWRNPQIAEPALASSMSRSSPSFGSLPAQRDHTPSPSCSRSIPTLATPNSSRAGSSQPRDTNTLASPAHKVVAASARSVPAPLSARCIRWKAAEYPRNPGHTASLPGRAADCSRGRRFRRSAPGGVDASRPG